MAISSADKLVVIKAFAPGNPLPLDAREIYDSLAAAQSFAATAANAYAGETIKVVEGNSVTVYTLVPSSTEGVNYDLSFVGGGAGSGVQNISTSTTEGNISVVTADGESTASKNVPVVGALVNPVVDEDAHTLTLTKIGATAAENINVVIPLGGASPETMISAVAQGTDALTLKVSKFDPETETTSEETIQLFGAVTDVDGATAGMVDFAVMGADGSVAHTKEALVGSVINASYDATNKVLTLPVVTGVVDGVVQTSDVAIDLKASVAGAFVDVVAAADTADSSAKLTFTFKDASGASQTKEVFESGVRKVEAGSVADKIKVTTADIAGALTSTEILVGAGSVKNPTYDAETRKITLPILQADGTTSDLAINLGKDMVVKSGIYDAVNKNIVLTLTDDSTVTIAAADLVDIYTGAATQTATVNVSDSNEITVDVKVAEDAANLLKVDTTNGGLYVKEADFTATKQLITDAQAAAEKHADDAVAAETEARETAVAAAQAAAEKHADDAVAAEVTARDQAIAAAKTEVNGYTDQKVAAEAEARATAIETAQAAAEKHADDAVAAETAARETAVAAAQEAAEKHADDAVAAEATARGTAVSNALTEAKAYTDTETNNRKTAVTEAIATANSYTDEQIQAEAGERTTAIENAQAAAEEHADEAIAAEVTARNEAIATAKTEVNGYTDQQVSAEATARNTAISEALAEAKEYAEQQATSVGTTWVDFGAEVSA